jgi:hypothetical protein
MFPATDRLLYTELGCGGYWQFFIEQKLNDEQSREGVSGYLVVLVAMTGATTVATTGAATVAATGATPAKRNGRQREEDEREMNKGVAHV